MSETNWLTDASGNRCSIEYFGTQKAAQTALESLKDCEKCENCSRCSDCSGCSRCSDCSRCSRCSDCSGCSRCSDCSGCSRCSRCSDCSGCSRCSDCSGCSGCSDCSGCSGCSDCSHIAKLWDKKDLAAVSPETGELGAPSVPKIENIHQAVYAVASQPKALNMGDWHTCANTHCRAGWIVTLAGEAGKKLEAFHNTCLAAQLIYAESGYDINPSRFFDHNERALADMKRLAETSTQEPT